MRSTPTARGCVGPCSPRRVPAGGWFGDSERLGREIRRRRRWKANPGLRAEVGGLPYDRAVATNDIVRQNALARIDAVQGLVHALSVGSPIAAVLTDAYFQEQRKWAGDEADLENAEWPPLLGWTIAPWRADEIALLDSDIQMVRDHPTSDPVQATAWLSAKRGELRRLRAGLVETTAKARALAFAEASDGWTVIFDRETVDSGSGPACGVLR